MGARLRARRTRAPEAVRAAARVLACRVPRRGLGTRDARVPGPRRERALRLRPVDWSTGELPGDPAKPRVRDRAGRRAAACPTPTNGRSHGTRSPSGTEPCGRWRGSRRRRSPARHATTAAARTRLLEPAAVLPGRAPRPTRVASGAEPVRRLMAMRICRRAVAARHRGRGLALRGEVFAWRRIARARGGRRSRRWHR